MNDTEFLRAYKKMSGLITDQKAAASRLDTGGLLKRRSKPEATDTQPSGIVADYMKLIRGKREALRNGE